VRVELVDRVDEVLKIALVPPAPPASELATPEGESSEIGPVQDGLTH
jgi:hypothetical protein